MTLLLALALGDGEWSFSFNNHIIDGRLHQSWMNHTKPFSPTHLIISWFFILWFLSQPEGQTESRVPLSNHHQLLSNIPFIIPFV